MAQFHFVEDYEKLVDELVAAHPLDQAMEIAVGGSYERFGLIEMDVLRRAGLQSGMSVLDLGCGSGRLASALGKSDLDIDYLGIDIVQKLLDYASTKSPASYRFRRHRALSIPCEENSLDIIAAFSLFTHLLHHETYLYLEDAFRVLKPGGRIVLSFLEFGAEFHWPTFLGTVASARAATTPHLNSFMERSAIATWASKLGFSLERIFGPLEAVSSVGALGQSIAVLRRPIDSDVPVTLPVQTMPETVPQVSSDPNGPSLVDLAHKYGTDKVLQCPVYDEYLSSLRSKRINFLEIGVGGYADPNAGGASLRMWNEYFPQGQIFALDFYDKTPHAQDRIRVYRGSQEDRVLLESIASDMGRIDVVLDDGSHVSSHVITSFCVLFPLLALGGLYIVEDIGTSYWPDYGGSEDFGNPQTSMSFFKRLADGIQHPHFKHPFTPEYPDVHAEYVHFFRNIIIVKKRDPRSSKGRLPRDTKLAEQPPSGD